MTDVRARRDERGGAGAAPLLACVLAALLFGASTPAGKVLLGDLGPLRLAGLLYLGGALGVLPFAFSGGSGEARRQARNLWRMGGIVLFGGVLGPVLLLAGLRLASAADVSLWLNLETPATLVVGWLAFRERVGAWGGLAAVVVTVASALLAGSEGLALLPAAGLLVAACLCWGLDNNLAAVLDGFTPAQSTLVKGFAAGSVNLALGLALEGPLPGVPILLAALLVGSLGYGASIVLYVRGAQALGATRSQMIFASAPFFGVLLAWGALGESIRAVQVLAAGMMVGAFWLMQRERHVHPHVHPAGVHTHWHRHDDEHHEHAHDAETGATWHTHEHAHERLAHTHPHGPDIHHRHDH